MKTKQERAEAKADSAYESPRRWKLVDSATMDGRQIRQAEREHATLLAIDALVAEQQETNRLLRLQLGAQA